MEFVEWTEKYTVGNPLVDAYHHIFFQMVDEFRTVLAQDAPNMEDRIAFLVDYTLMHFESEEKLMEKAGYPDFESPISRCTGSSGTRCWTCSGATGWIRAR